MLDRLRRRLRRRPTPTRAELIDRKHRLEGEIRQLDREIRNRASHGEDVAHLESRLERMRTRHVSIRLLIDRTE